MLEFKAPGMSVMSQRSYSISDIRERLSMVSDLFHKSIFLCSLNSST